MQPGSIQRHGWIGPNLHKDGPRQRSREITQESGGRKSARCDQLAACRGVAAQFNPKQALEYLQHAEALAPAAHTDLLIAHAYERLGQIDQFTNYLNRAKERAPKDPEVLRAVAG